MKRENILITENYTTKRVAATKFIAPGDVPAFDCSIHFGKEGNDVTLQNCIIQDNALVKCSPEDTYDFETGALISLMKMCGVEKVKKAAKETFFDVAENSVNEYEEKIHALEEEIKRLKGESEKRWKIYQRSIQKKQDRINELQAQIKASEDDKQKNIEYYEKEIKNLKYRLTCKDISLEAKDKKISIYEKRILALEAENEKLKLDCEMLQHGYNNADMVFCGGRQNGKQHTLLVDLFKKIDQKKVDAAYKEAYNTTLPLWQREFLKEALSIYKPPTKREEMWNKILTNDKVAIKVKKDDVNSFLIELEERNNTILWGSKRKATEVFKSRILMKDFHSKDYCYFYIDSKCKISYALMLLGKYKDYTLVDYLSPMRWDLFKKGRLIVKVDADNYEDFYNKCEVEIGRKPHYTSKGTFTVYYKNGTFHTRPYNDTIPFAKKIVNWEDVR